MSEDTSLIIDDYTIEDLKQIFNLKDDFNKDDVNNSLVELLKKYSILGETKYIKFLRVARDKLLVYLAVQLKKKASEQSDITEMNDEESEGDQTDNEDEVNEVINNIINESTLYQKHYLQDVHTTNNIINRKNSTINTDEDKHFIFTRNREQVLQGNHNIPVVQGQMNPVLRNINKRIISLDTKMRNYLNEDTNDLTLDLSEPLNNILAIRVLSVEIRHCWYTFDDAYGTAEFTVDNSLITIENGNYSETELMTHINDKLTTSGFNIDFSYNSNNGKVIITNNDGSTRTIVFYDDDNPGNMKKNSNLGWLLGYRLDNSNNITTTIDSGSTSTGSSLVDVYGPKYILLQLEDFNNNHFNRNFITVDDNIDSLKFPSYHTHDLSMSDPHYRAIIDEDGLIQWVDSGLTHKQAFTISEIHKSRQSNPNQNKVSGMRTNDILSKLPVQYTSPFKTLIIGNNFLNKNERLYYGPVNINRVRISLYNDAGQLLNLNGHDYAITLQTDELYQY